MSHNDATGSTRQHRLDRWLYRGGRPNWLARTINRVWATVFAAGVLQPDRLATLQVPGRRTGRIISFPLVIADHQGERYLVAMLGQSANWVYNVRAAGGRAVLRHGHRENVRLEEVDPGARAPILRRYVASSPGGRAHIRIDPQAPLTEFEQVAEQYPVFHIAADRPAAQSGSGRWL